MCVFTWKHTLKSLHDIEIKHYIEITYEKTLHKDRRCFDDEIDMEIFPIFYQFLILLNVISLRRRVFEKLDITNHV